MVVDGHTILRSNNYDLEEGEKSVWDRELGNNRDDENVSAMPQPSEQPKPAKKRTYKPAARAPRVATSDDVARSAMRDRIKAEIADAAGRRAAFAVKHAAALSAFGADLSGLAEKATQYRSRKAAVPPPELTATLREHQLEGLRWLVSMHDCGVSQILGDEMGLGKTIQTIALLAFLKFSRKLVGPSLVVCPLSVLASWMVEFRRFCPSLRVVKLHSGDPIERERLRKEVLKNPENYDVVVTTYEMAKSPSMSTALAGQTWWRYLVLDEGHLVKNEESEISKAVRRIHFGHCLLLTGTPLQNNLHELWALLNVLHPDWLPDASRFDAAFALDGTRAKADPQQLRKASELLRPLMLRRLKVDVERKLPPKVETKIMCQLTEIQAFWYKRLLLKGSEEALNALEKNGEVSPSHGAWKKLQSLLVQLRKCVNHPYLFEGADPNPGVTDEATIAASGKLRMLDRLLARLIEKGHRAVVFSQYTATLDVIDDVLRFRGIRFCRLDGGTNRVQRTVDINAFNAPGSQVKVFVMSTRAGGLGINLQTADTCILYDSDWNPQADLQAMARVHRIGQSKVVHVYRLVTSGTVEERIVQRAEKKLYLDKMVNNQSPHDNSASAPSGVDDVGANEMLSAITFGAHAVVNRPSDSGDTDLDDAAIDAIIDRTRSETSSVEGLISGGAAKSTLDYDADATTTTASIRELRGVLYGSGEDEKKRKSNEVTTGDIGLEWSRYQDTKRIKKQRIVTTKVKGVGEVGVLASSIREDDDDADLVAAKHRARDAGLNEFEKKRNDARRAAATWDAEAKAAAEAGVGKRQKAGRDYEHESHCLYCWDGGEILCCDVCPTSWHLECLEHIGFGSPFKGKSSKRGGKSASRATLGTWACPHHSCATCARKSAAAGGLLFRCIVCPHSYCEDHLPAHSRVIGHCERFQALGQRHPSQACFILCSQSCVEWAKQTGDIRDDTDYGTADGIIGATGVDTTAKAKAASFATDNRSDLDRLDETSRAVVMALAGKGEASRILDACPRFASKEGKKSIDSLAGLLLSAGIELPGGDEKRLIERVGEWSGADGSGSIKVVRDRMASLLLHFERTLDTWRSYEIQELASTLDVLKLNPPENGRSSKTSAFNNRQPFGVFVTAGSGGLSRKILIKIIATFLAWPRQTSLFAVKLTPKMLGEDLAEEAERAAAKKGAGVMKRRAEAKRLRALSDERKASAINDLFLYPLLDKNLATNFGLPLTLPHITVFTHNVARDAPTVQLKIVKK